MLINNNSTKNNSSPFDASETSLPELVKTIENIYKMIPYVNNYIGNNVFNLGKLTAVLVSIFLIMFNAVKYASTEFSKALFQFWTMVGQVVGIGQKNGAKKNKTIDDWSDYFKNVLQTLKQQVPKHVLQPIYQRVQPLIENVQKDVLQPAKQRLQSLRKTAEESFNKTVQQYKERDSPAQIIKPNKTEFCKQEETTCSNFTLSDPPEKPLNRQFSIFSKQPQQIKIPNDPHPLSAEDAKIAHLLNPFNEEEQPLQISLTLRPDILQNKEKRKEFLLATEDRLIYMKQMQTFFDHMKSSYEGSIHLNDLIKSYDGRLLSNVEQNDKLLVPFNYGNNKSKGEVCILENSGGYCNIFASTASEDDKRNIHLFLQMFKIYQSMETNGYVVFYEKTKSIVPHKLNYPYVRKAKAITNAPNGYIWISPEFLRERTIDNINRTLNVIDDTISTINTNVTQKISIVKNNLSPYFEIVTNPELNDAGNQYLLTVLAMVTPFVVPVLGYYIGIDVGLDGDEILKLGFGGNTKKKRKQKKNTQKTKRKIFKYSSKI